MRNPDLATKQRNELMQRLNEAVKSGDEEQFAQAFTEFAEGLQNSIVDEAQQVVQTVDTNVLANRGVRQLTSKEKDFYQKTIDAMRSNNPKQELDDLDVVMPETVIDAIFEDLKQEHELLSEIDFMNTTGITKLLLNTNGKQLAKWGPLGSEIEEELESGFKLFDMTLNKLSAFIPISQDMLDLGPVWLDRYIREILGEAIAFGLEEGIINGDGKDQPIGMIRQVGDGVTVTGGKYPAKETEKLDSLEPIAYGKILAKMTKVPKSEDEEKDTTRKIANVLMIVNPTDYLTKIMPATTIRGTDGLYRNDVLPFPTKVVQSVQVEEGKAVIGLGKRFFMGIGTAKSGKIEYSDDYRFLEDERVYKTKLYGHGQPLDNNAFVYVDISEMEPANLSVKVVGGGDGDLGK